MRLSLTRPLIGLRRYTLSYCVGVATLFAAWGCVDDPATPRSSLELERDAMTSGGARSDADMTLGDDGGSVDSMVAEDGDTEPTLRPTPEPSWIEISVAPQRTLYRVGDEITVSWMIFDLYGVVIEDEEWDESGSDRPVTTLRVNPPEFAIFDGAEMTILTPGVATLEVCVLDVCGQRSLIADDGPPKITISSPQQGEMLEGGELISVQGVVIDGGGSWITVRVNQEVISLDDSGAFAHAFTPEFGVNTVTVTATDDLTGHESVSRRDVLWAPRYQPSSDERGLSVPDVLSVRVDQALFDTDAAPPESLMGPLGLDGFAQLIEVVLSLTSLDALADAPLFGDSEGDFEISEISLGPPQVDFSITSSGLEFFLYFSEVTLQTVGSVTLEGQELNLTGMLSLSLAARVELLLEITDLFRVEVGESQVSIESISGDFEAEGFEALINALSDRLLESIEETFNDVVDDLLREQLGEVLRNALVGIFGDLRALEIELPSTIEGGPSLSLNVSLYPTSFELSPRSWVKFLLDLDLSLGTDVNLRDGDRGVALPRPQDQPTREGAGLGFSFSVTLFNALFHEIWRGGLLSLTPELPPELGVLVTGVNVSGLLPPLIAFAAPGASRPLKLQLGGLLIEIQTPQAEQPDVFLLNIESGLSLALIEGQLRLEVDDEPVITATLLEARSPLPLQPELIENLVRLQLWDTLRSAFTSGFDFGFGAFEIDAESLAELSESIESLAVTPLITGDLEVRGDQLSFEGALEILLGLTGP